MNLVDKFLEDAKQANALAKNNNLEHCYDDLFWYDKKFSDVISPSGIEEITAQYISEQEKQKPQADEIATNYSIESIYSKDIQALDNKNRYPTAWNYSSLPSQPWYDNVICNGLDVFKLLEDNFETIRKEYDNYISQNMGTHPDNSTLMGKGTWNGLFLYFVAGKTNPEALEFTPETYKVVDQLPLCKNFGFVMFSEMLPNSHVLPHCGSSNLRLRIHLGIKIPEPDKSKIRVGDTWRHWKEGKAFAFDDSFEHEVTHDGDQNRVILSLDIWHPALSEKEIELFSNPLFSSFGRLV